MDEDRERAPLTPLSMHILLALAERDLHGYALMQAIREQSGGAVRPGTGSLYAAVQRLLDDGHVAVAVGDEPESARRGRTYELTPAGRSAVRAEAARLRGVLDLASRRRLAPAADEA